MDTIPGETPDLPEDEAEKPWPASKPPQTQPEKTPAPAPNYPEIYLPPELAEEPKDIPRKIHILGTGSIGKFVAHSLRDLPNPPPVSLIFHTSDYYRQWQNSRKVITIRTEGIGVARGGFEAEFVPAAFRRHGKLISKEEFNDPESYTRGLDMYERMEKRDDEEMSEKDLGIYIPDGSTSDEPIHNLIVSVKASISVSALQGVKNRLGPDSTILFLQNGLGQIDEVNEEVFSDPETRPSYLSGVISHGVHSHDNMDAVHAGFGTIAIGVPPSKPSSKGHTQIPSASLDTMSPSSRYLLRTMCRSPVLAAVPNSPTELFQAQLEKLAANAIINPLTSLMDARNGALNYNFAVTRATRLLLGEISLVIRSLPELSSLPNVNTRFAPDRLETLIVGIANRTRNNISSMLADMRKGNMTEIDYINGYIVKRGEELGITCYMNYLITQLVKGKQRLISHEKQDELPAAGPPRQVRNQQVGTEYI